VAFQVTNYTAATPEEFIEAIRPQVSLYVYQRDLAENPPTPVNISGWGGHTVEVDAFELPATAIPESQLPPSSNPEITV
jgi:hypothetical protein